MLPYIFAFNNPWSLLLMGGLEGLIPLIPILAVVVVIITLVVRVALVSKFDKKRTEGLTKAAADMSLPFSKAVTSEQVDQLTQFPLMQRGSSRESSNAIVAETAELRLMLLDHKYVSGSGKNKSVHRQTVAWVASNRLNMPSFSLCPESWFDRLGDWILRRDIDFDEDPEFSQKFALSGSDQASIREFFSSRRRQALLKINLPYVEAMRHGFIFYRPGMLLDPSELKSLMNDAFVIYQAFAPEQSLE